MRVRPAGPLSVALPDSVHLQVGPYLTHQRPAWRGSFLRILRIPRHGAPAGLQRCTAQLPQNRSLSGRFFVRDGRVNLVAECCTARWLWATALLEENRPPGNALGDHRIAISYASQAKWCNRASVPESRAPMP